MKFNSPENNSNTIINSTCINKSKILITQHIVCLKLRKEQNFPPAELGGYVSPFLYVILLDNSTMYYTFRLSSTSTGRNVVTYIFQIIMMRYLLFLWIIEYASCNLRYDDYHLCTNVEVSGSFKQSMCLICF